MTIKNNGQRQAILWGRFSSDQQSDGDSRERQERNNRAYAMRKGLKIIGEYFDEASSVKEGPTPYFEKLIASLPDGVGIVAEDLDRISRGHPIEQQAFLWGFVKAGKHFVCTSSDDQEYNQDTMKQVATLTIGNLKSTLGYAENQKRINRVREEKAKAIELARQGKPAPLGKWLPSHLQYNFETGQYIIREDRKAIYKRIFEEYLSGKGTPAIAKGLNNDGLPTFFSKKVGGWTRSTICQMLRYQGVIGVLVIKGERIPNAFPPAISEDLFYKVEKMLEQNKGTVKLDKDGKPLFVEVGRKGKDGQTITVHLPVMANGRHGNYTGDNVNNVFRGLCKCSVCGGNIKVFKRIYLGCDAYREAKKTNGNQCTVKNLVKYSEMEHSLLKWFVPQVTEALLGKDESFARVETLSAKKTALEAKIEETMTLMDEGLPIDKVKARLKKLQAERQQVESDLASAKAEQSTKAILPDTLASLEKLIAESLDNQEVRKKIAALVPTIIKEVKVDLSDRNSPKFLFALTDGCKIGWAFDQTTGKGMALNYFGKGTNWKDHGLTLSPVKLPKTR